jgi:glycosyltransferase involved in cell wall biosynthesis
MWFFPLPEARPYTDSPEAPSLNFIGRTEKRKGPHLFLQIAWWLPDDSYSAANIIGPENIDHKGVASSEYLRAIAQPRVSKVRFHRCMTPSEMAALYATKSVSVLPSQYDTLNLTALESLFAGCPTAIGDGAGVCRYLNERFPEIPYVTIPIRNWYTCVPKIEAILGNYKEYREDLQAAVASADVAPRGPGVEQVYTAPQSFAAGSRVQLEHYYEELLQAAPVHQKTVRRQLRVAA